MREPRVTDRADAISGASFKGIGYFCLYAIGPEHGRPLKIGYAADLVSRLKAAQSGNWIKIGVHTACWVQEVSVVRRLERETHSRLKGRVAGEWFDVSIPVAEKAMVDAARALGVSPLTHDDMLMHVAPYRLFVKYPNLFWPNARRLPNRGYAA